MERPRARFVADILEPGRLAALVTEVDHPTQYPCRHSTHTVGAPRQAWPTLVAHENARGFKEVGGVACPGMVYDQARGNWEEPTTQERELAMGFMAGATACKQMTEKDRRAALGRATDLNALHWLFTTMTNHLEKEFYDSDFDMEGDYFDPPNWPPIGPVFMALDGGGAEHRGGGKDGGGWECLSPGARGRVANMGPGGRLAREAVEALLTTHCQTFAYTLKELGCCNYAIMTLNLTTTVPVYQRRRRMSPQDLEVCREKCLELLEAGLIRRSESSYAVATVVAARMDLAGTVLSRRIATAEEHVERLAEMLRRIKEAGLTFHPKKCRFGHTSVTYLGFEVAGGKVAIQKAKVAVLDCVAQPKDKSALRALLGFLKYYRKFVENFSKRAAPLNRLLREDLKW
ncbi:unnamed protein product [Closterium sp. NIES-53]